MELHCSESAPASPRHGATCRSTRLERWLLSITLVLSAAAAAAPDAKALGGDSFDFVLPSSGSAPISGNQSLPLAVRLLRGGSPLPPPANEVCFEFSPTGNPDGASLSGGTGSCGVGGRLVPTGSDGSASVVLASSPGMCGQTRVRATTTGLASPLSLEFVLTGSDPVLLFAAGGSGQSAAVNTAFGENLRAQLSCGSSLPLVGRSLRWEVTAGSSVQFDGGSSASSLTDNTGVARIPVRARGEPGTAVVRACAEPTGSCLINASFSLSVNPAMSINLDGGAGTLFEAPPGGSVTLVAAARNDGQPAQAVPIDWALVSGDATLAASSNTTDANGLAQNVLQLGSTPGLRRVRASRPGTATAFTDFSIEAVDYRLQHFGPSGSTPVIEVGQPTLLQVQLLRESASSVPQVGAPISFSLASGSSDFTLLPLGGGMTDQSGIATVEFEASSAGSYEILARFDAGPGFGERSLRFRANVVEAGAALRVVSAPAQLVLGQTSGQGIRIGAFSVDATGAEVPTADIDVGVQVEVGDAGFSDGTSFAVVRTDASGEAETLPLRGGTRAGPIRIRVFAGGHGEIRFELPQLASELQLELLPLAQMPRLGEPFEVSARLLSSAAGTGAPVADAQIRWTSSGGQLDPQLSTTDAMGLARTQVRFDTSGTYTLEASFEPGLGLPAVRASLQLRITGPELVLLSGDGQTAPAGSDLPFPLVFEARNGGLPLPGLLIDLSAQPAGSAVIQPASAVTGSDGRAQFTVRLGANAQGQISLLARNTATGLQATAFARVGNAPLQRSLLAISGDGQSAAPGSSLAQPLIVQALNDGQAAAGVPINFTISPAGAALLEPASGLTDASGRLQTRLNLLAGASGAISVLASRSDDPAADVRFLVFAGSGGVERRLEIDAGNGQTVLTGARASELVVRYLVDGQAVEGVRIGWSLIGGNATLDAAESLSDTSGRARMGLRAEAPEGDIRVRAQADGLDVQFTLRSVAGRLEAVAGNSQRGLAGAPLAQPLQVRLQPALAGITVEWRIGSGGGQLAAGSSLTDSTGLASMAWTLGAQAGRQTALARLPGATDVEFEAFAEATGGRLEIVSGSTQGLAMGSDAALIVLVRDTAGAPQAGRSISWSGSNASLSATASVSDAQGRAQINARLLQPGEARIQARLDNSQSQVEFVLNGGLSSISGLNSRQRSVAGALDRACAALAAASSLSAGQQDLLARCADFIGAAGNDRPGLLQAFDQLPNDVGLSLARAGDESLRGQLANLDQRQRALRGGGQRLQVAFGLSTPTGMLPLSALPGLAGAVDANATESEIGADFERWGAFVTGSVGRGRSRGQTLNPSFDYSLGSLTAGVDYRFSDSLILGAALGLSRDDTDFANGRGELQSRGTSLSLYASFWLPKEWYLDAGLNLGRNQFELDRRLNFTLGGNTIDQRAGADTDGQLFGGSLALGRDWQSGAWSLGGYLRGQFSRIDYDAFSETLIAGRPGTGLALSVSSPRWESLEAILGGRASRVISRDWGVFMPNLLVEYSREFRDDASRLDMQFVNDPTGTVFNQSGAAIDQSHFNLGLGATALFPGGRSAFFQYERRIGDDRISHWMFSVGGRMEF